MSENKCGLMLTSEVRCTTFGLSVIVGRLLWRGSFGTTSGSETADSLPRCPATHVTMLLYWGAQCNVLFPSEVRGL